MPDPIHQFEIHPLIPIKLFEVTPRDHALPMKHIGNFFYLDADSRIFSHDLNLFAHPRITIDVASFECVGNGDDVGLAVFDASQMAEA